MDSLGVQWLKQHAEIHVSHNWWAQPLGEQIQNLCFGYGPADLERE